MKLAANEAAKVERNMSGVTIRVLDGFEMGSVFENLSTPITIGRERENVISLNDEQVSRFHAKIQDSDGNLIFTDLDSTNGTRVNGRPTRLRVLAPGDQIQVGRSLLVVNPPAVVADMTAAGLEDGDSGGFELARATHTAAAGPLDAWPAGCPPLPSQLSTVQLARLTDILGWMHDRLTRALESGEECDDDPPSLAIPPEEWRRLQDAAYELSRRIRQLTNADDSAV